MSGKSIHVKGNSYASGNLLHKVAYDAVTVAGVSNDRGSCSKGKNTRDAVRPMAGCYHLKTGWGPEERWYDQGIVGAPRGYLRVTGAMVLLW